MFKNREFRMRVVKTPESQTAQMPTLAQVLNPDSVKLIEETGRRFVRNLAITVVCTVGAIIAIDTLGEIAVNAAPKK